LPTVVRSLPTAASWREALVGSSDEDLFELFRLRPDLILADPASLGEVAERMVSPASSSIYFEEADRSARQLLEALCVLPSPTTVGALAGALGCASEALTPVVVRLGAAGMLLRDGEEITANPGLVGAVAYPCCLGPPAAGLLERLTNSELAAIAARLGLPGHGAKPALVRRVTAALGDADRVAALVEAAPAQTGDLLQLAGHDWPALQLSYGVAVMACSDDRPTGWCLRRGLILGTGYGTAVMPREVSLALRRGRLFPSFVPEPPDLASGPLDQELADRRGADAALAMVADVAAVCEAWSAAPAKLLQAGGLGVREVRRAAKMTGREEDTMARLIDLAAAAGLVDADEGEVMPTAAYDRWREGGSARRWVELASAWLEMPVHLSLAGAPDADGKAVPPLLERPFDPMAMVQRALVVGLLGAPGPGAAADAGAVRSRAQWQRPAIWNDDPAPAHAVIGWPLDEAGLLGVSSGGGLTTFARALTGGDTADAERMLVSLAPPVVTEVILQADLTATVTGEAAPPLRAELDLMADVESSGHATVWRFSEATLRRGFEAGRSAHQILAFLTDHAARGVPQPLAYLVEDLGRRYGQVRVGPAGCYVRSDDAALLAEILRAKKTAPLGLRALAPTVAVSSCAPEAVTAALRAGGYLAAGESPDGTLAVSRPPARRADARAGDAGAPFDGFDDGNDFDDDYFDGDFDGDLDMELLGELLDDPTMLTTMTGLPPALAGLMMRAAAAGSAIPRLEGDLEAFVERLRRAPVDASRPGPPSSGSRSRSTGRSPSPREPSPPGLFDLPAVRPTHIAKESRAVAELLASASDNDWPVRMGYVNAQGAESEFNAEILGVGRDRVRVRYLSDRPGGGELASYRVQWARILTPAEEEAYLR